MTGISGKQRLRAGLAAAGSLVAISTAVWVAGDTRAATSSRVDPSNVTSDQFDARNFTRSTTIDNRWFPLKPGTQFVMVGRANRGQGRRVHRVVFTVTDLTKVIDGVRAVVLWDRDYNGGRLEEGELTYHAQDDDGTVWNLGEYPEEWAHGKVTGAPDTWLAGVGGAKPGILMRPRPRVGTSSYLQGWAPAIDFADRAKVHRMGARNCIPGRCFDDVLLIDEWNPDEPGQHQLKYYARGVGTIRVGAAGGSEKETLVLEKVRHLGAKGMAFVRREATKVEKRAYRIRKDIYGATRPAEHRPAGG